VSVCGGDLSRLTGPDGTRFDRSHSELLAEWSSEMCTYPSTVRGVCGDGKRFLLRPGIFGSQVYYFEGETLVGAASTTDDGSCGDPCPFSGFSGPLESVRCDNPAGEPLCEVIPLRGELFLPFANGESPVECMPCEE
jgi:hypothetical protein